MTVEPIKPSEVDTKRQEQLPDAVFEAFNELISENWNGNQAIVLQKDVAYRIARKLNLTGKTIFDRGYLDVEPYYRKQGWKVKYDSPDFTESFEATFTFSKE